MSSRNGARGSRRQATKAAVLAGLSVGALVWGALLGQVRDRVVGGRLDTATAGERLVVYAAALGVVVFGVAAVRSASSAVRQAGAQPADNRLASLAFILSLLGYLLVAVATLSALRINLRGLLIGGAVSGVVIGIAAQQTLGNFFAGLVLLTSGSVRVGQDVFIKSGPLGEHAGKVIEMNLVYVHLLTDRGMVALPNAGVLAAAIGPGAIEAGQPEGTRAPEEAT